MEHTRDLFPCKFEQRHCEAIESVDFYCLSTFRSPTPLDLTTTAHCFVVCGCTRRRRGFVVLVYSLGTVINANNSNNKTSLAITTTTNNYVHLILLSSCLALLSVSYPRARFFHSRSLIFLPTLASFPSSTVCSACYCWYCCRRRPRRLILLEHNFNFCYVANTTEHSNTHTFPFFRFCFSRLLCRTHCCFYFILPL